MKNLSPLVVRGIPPLRLGSSLNHMRSDVEFPFLFLDDLNWLHWIKLFFPHFSSRYSYFIRMSEVTPSTENAQTTVTVTIADADTPTGSRRIATRAPRLTNVACNNAPRYFEGATPNVDGILALRNENVAKKVN